MGTDENFDEEKKIQGLIRKIPQDLGDLTEAVVRLRIEYVKRLRDLSRTYGVDFTEEALESFLKRPYAILPKSGERNEFYVAVPKFVDFQVGYLDHSTDSFNVFVITKYTQWLGQAIPDDLREELDFKKPEPITVTDGVISFPEEYEPVVAQRYGGYLTSISKGKARIRPGNEFDLIAEIIDNGSLPFVPKQVSEVDLREPQVKFELKGKYSYQRDAFDTFLKYGATGIFWMPGSGKTFIGMFILDSLKGSKLVVCPGRTMIEQWKSDIAEWSPRLKEELETGDLEIVTYHAYPKIRGKEYVCVIFDECHRLPADTFSRMATIKAKYRAGLSATPFREDGRTNYIFSLTGYPIGLDWKALVKLLGKTFHEVDVYILKNEREKLARVMELVDPERKTQIFSDGIELGKKISQKLRVPFIYGETKNRLEILRKEPVVVVSRVGDLGVSIKDLEHLVEADFLMGCFDSQTEILARDGWKKFSELSYSDEIATLNINGFIEYYKPIEIQEYPYTGPMIHFCGKNYDLLVTPNHNMYVRDHRKSDFGFIKAEGLARLNRGLWNYELKKDAKWKGQDTKFFEVPREFIRTKAPKSKSNPTKIPMGPFLKFLGWYLSEGSCRDGGIRIAQMGGPNRTEIRKIIEEMGMIPSEGRDGVWLHCRPLARYLKTLGISHTKVIPRWVKQLPPEKLELLITTMLRGDGTPDGKTAWIYYTTSKKLADDFQEIAIKSGYATTLRVRKRLMRGAFSKRDYELIEHSVIITRNSTTPQIEKRPILVNYKGKVHCVTVPNHVILVRRNGRAVWSGNSRTQELSRSTRLFHSMAKIKHHDILFTEDEFYLYRKRLHGLVERGFKINVQRFVRRPIAEAPVRRPHVPRRTVERVPKIKEPTEEERKVAAPFIQRKLKEIERVVNELTPNQRRILKFMTIAKRSPKSKIARALGIEEVNADVDGLVKLELLRKHPKHGFFYNLGRKVTSDLLTFKASAVDIKDAVKQIEKLIKEWE